MSKVFTITEGLENMGALRTGGQGSVYKGKRIGEIITAVKLLPTPIHSESEDDKNFRDFQNEVQKLKKVNEQPNPNVVKILSSGLTDSGGFPFIEMEYIDGPDLEELLRPPHDKVFTIKETIKVADQLACALAHCHHVGVRHGDIKSNNVKFNLHSGNYVLLDFGLSVMSDEQRRTSLRHAGAIEFMAPEQNEGKMLYQTDIYSYGVILYELLAGRVPFPLKDNGETSRNHVMVSHMEQPVPDLMELRAGNLPDSWSEEVRHREMQVPAWLLNIIDTCLQKSPDKRFADGSKLHDAIVEGSVTALNNFEQGSGVAASVMQSENKQLHMQVAQQEQELKAKQQEIDSLRASLENMPAETDSSAVSISRPFFWILILLTISLIGFSAYSLVNRYNPQTTDITPVVDSLTTEQAKSDSAKKGTRKAVEVDTSLTNFDSPDDVNDQVITNEIDSTLEAQKDTVKPAAPAQSDQDIERSGGGGTKYKLAGQRAYFYSKPDESTRRDGYLAYWNNAELTAIEDRNGFIYVIFFNSQGQMTKGWLRKIDLKQL